MRMLWDSRRWANRLLGFGDDLGCWGEICCMDVVIDGRVGDGFCGLGI